MTSLRSAFQKQGYVVVEDVLSPDEVQAACEEISAIIAGDAPNSEHIMVEIEPAIRRGEQTASSRELSVRKLMSFVPHSDMLTRIAENANIKNVLRELLGDDVKLLQDMALLKPPFIGSRKTWHQDCAYFPVEPANVVGFWIALDAATTENGCMWVRPETHREAIPHAKIPEETFEDFGIPKDHAVLSDVAPVAVPLDPGDALVFHGLTVHGTEPNVSPNRRRALQLHYMDARCRYTGANQKPAFRQILGRSYDGCV
jgi:phytanoyl-CoA hydroxylase